MIGRLLRAWRARRESRTQESLDALKVRYHTFRILLANNERALDRLAAFENALSAGADAGELAGLVEDLQAVTFELVDGVTRLDGGGARPLYARQLRLEEALRDAVDDLEEAVRPPSCLSLAQALTAEAVGGKAAGLSELTRNGFPVPPGFAITARACRDMLCETGLDARIRDRLRGLGRDDEALETACRAIHDDIMGASLPDWLRADLAAAAAALPGASPALAVRSSALTEDGAEHSFAGQFTTELNLRREILGQGFLTVMAGAFGRRAVAYRLEAGLPAATLDMAVLVQVMIPAVAAGVIFTLDPVRPESGRMLVSAVPGLGIAAVDGDAPTDIFRVLRADPADVLVRPATKTSRVVPDAAGGIRREDVPADQREIPVLSPDTLTRLTRLALAAEGLAGAPRDLEYAIDAAGTLWMLQSRPIVGAAGRAAARDDGSRQIYEGGMTAAPGRIIGRIRHIASLEGIETAATEPIIAVLPAAAPEATRLLSAWSGVVVAGGNPADHLSTVAREAGRPMLTRAAGAMEALPEGVPVVLDAAKRCLRALPPAVGAIGDLLGAAQTTRGRTAKAPLSPARTRLHDLIVPLTLTDAYGPTFSVLECSTLHDIIRFAHETAVIALFEAGDAVLDEASSKVRILRGTTPFEIMVIDLGGGLGEEAQGRFIGPEALSCLPLAALWQGIETPGLRFGAPLPGADAAGITARSLVDGRSRRPVGEPNYALVARDYLNLNARMEFHFAMVDAVCGPRGRGNYVRLRFKGGGAATPLRLRRAACLEDILKTGGFFVNRQGDLVGASLLDAGTDATTEALTLIGRLLGFTRLLDAAMVDDDAPRRAAQAFWAGDYGLQGFVRPLAGPDKAAMEQH